MLVQRDVLSGLEPRVSPMSASRPVDASVDVVVSCDCSRETLFCRIVESVEEETELRSCHATACRSEPNIVLMVEINFADAW